MSTLHPVRVSAKRWSSREAVVAVIGIFLAQSSGFLFYLFLFCMWIYANDLIIFNVRTLQRSTIEAEYLYITISAITHDF